MTTRCGCGYAHDFARHPCGCGAADRGDEREGTSTIQNIEQIDRGYKDIDGRLNALGARITRVEE